MSRTILILLLCFNLESVESTLFVNEVNDGTFVRENISVTHDCFFGYSLCAQISLKLSSSKFKEMYQESSCLECDDLLRRSKHISQQSFKSTLPLIIKEEYVCRPDYWNHDPIFITATKLSVFIIQTRFIKKGSTSSLSRRKAFIKQYLKYDLVIPSPYSRKECILWRNNCPSLFQIWMHLAFSGRYDFFRSPKVSVPFHLTTNVIVSLQQMGQYIFFPKNQNNHYFERFLISHSKRFTISLWLYLYSNCMSSYCNILSFFDDLTEGFTSPALLLKENGQFHIQSLLLNSESFSAFITNFKAPLRSWFQLVFSMDRQKWSLTLASTEGIILEKSVNIKFTEEINLDWTKGFGVIGGSQVFKGVEAYISDVFFYPGEYLIHTTVIQARRNHVFKKLQLTNLEKTQTCLKLTAELEYYWENIKQKLKREKEKNSCKHKTFSSNIFGQLMCFPRNRDHSRPRLFSYLETLVRNNSKLMDQKRTTKDINISIGIFLFERAFLHIKRTGLKVEDLILKYLEESNCLEYPEATYVLATLHFYGIGIVRMNVTRSLELLLLNTLRSQHRLSLLALGNMHKFNLDPSMESLSAVYYKNVADLAGKDIHNLQKEDMYNDRIRLTNEAQIKEHTDEDGELFYWIKHQAEAGIPWAKERLGRIFFWGSQGIQRNYNQAANYLRLAAQGPDAQPQNHFDYGILLVKNSNKKEDIEEGTAQLEKAAEKDPRALTTLGWLAETRDKNYKLAYEYYLKAHNLGNAEATYNIGTFYHTGRIPGQPLDKKTAFSFFTKAAVQNQLNSGNMYSHYQLSGIAGFLEKNITMGISWARFIGEQNPRVGFYLSEGVRAYRKQKIELSVFYYLLAAFTGLELANFNIAVLCEEYEILVKKYVEKECIWYHYNLSIQREEQHIHPYSLIKMGDKHWYGCGETPRDIKKAAEFYLRAAIKHEPQAYFNLAFIMEHGEVDIIPMLLGKVIQFTGNKESNSSKKWNYNYIIQLYQKCEDLSEHNTYLPCKLASKRLYVVRLWQKVKINLQTLVAIVLTIIIVYKFIKLWFYNSNNNDRPSP